MRRARLNAGLTLAQVAGQELTRQAVHHIEMGRMRPSMRTLRLVARRLRVPVASLMINAREQFATIEQLTVELRGMHEAHRYDDVVELARELLESVTQVEFQAVARFYLGIALHHLAHSDEALKHLDKAHDLFRRAGDPWRAAEAIDWKACALHQKEDPRAYDVGRDALQRYQALDPRQPEVEARILEHLGTFLVLRRDYPAALDCYDRALAVASSVHDLTRLARIYHGRSMCRWTLGEQGPAIEGMEKSVMLYRIEDDLRPRGARTVLPRAENDLGTMYMRRGQLERADEMFTSALEHLAEAGVDQHRSNLLLSLADLRACQGHRDEAAELIDEAMDLAGRFGEAITLAAAHRQRAQLLAERGELETVKTHFREALRILEEQGMTERKAEYLAAYEAILNAQRDEPWSSAELA